MFIKSKIYLLLLFGLIYNCWSQSGVPESITQSKKWDFQISLHNYFLDEDYFLGTSLGAINSNRNLSVFTEFDIRPFKKKVLDRQGANLYYQLFETRVYWGLGAEYSFFPKDGNIGLFFQPSLLYTWGEYSGTEIDVPKGLFILPKIGAIWQFGSSGLLKAGVAFLDDHTERESQFSIFIQISGINN
jgi:hypothetical protein